MSSSYGGPPADIKTEAELWQKFQGPVVSDSSIPSFGQAVEDDLSALSAWTKQWFGSWGARGKAIDTPGKAFWAITSPFPVIKTLAHFNPIWFLQDTAAGLVEGVMKIPSGLAYALLCNMPPQYGLYTSLMPPFIYMLMGTCAQISFGVTAIEAIFLGDSVTEVLGEDIINSATNDEIEDGSNQADIDIVVEYTLFISFMVGLWQLLFRVLHLGSLSVLLSDPLMSGFSTGGAFIVATSQLSSFLGYNLGNSEFLPGVWVKALQHIPDWNWVSIALGTSVLVVLWLLQTLNRKFAPKYPFPWQILIVIFSIIIATELELKENNNVKVIGDIPNGFPDAGFPMIPDVPGKTTSELVADSILPSFLIAIFVYVMTLSLGTFFSHKNGYQVDPEQELLTVGVSNTISSMCGAFICSASFSRTVVLHTLNAKTVLHGVAAIILMILAVTTIASTLTNLPKTVLAAIVINAIGPMVEFNNGAKYYVTNKWDFAVWLVTFICCLCLGASYGIYIGVAAALFILILKAVLVKIAVLGRLPGTEQYRDITRFPMGQRFEGVRIIRFDGGLNFVNWQRLVKRVRQVNKDVHSLVLDASAITSLDSTALHGLEKLVHELDERGVKLILANWKAPQRDFLTRSGFYDVVPQDTIFLTLHDAVTFARTRAVSPSKVPNDPATITEAGGQTWRIGYSAGKADKAAPASD